MKHYHPAKIEKKWQKRWREENLFAVNDNAKGSKRYVLVEFPYPSGNLHVGHWYAFSIPDIYVRAKRMQGENVLYPIGFDAFGLPAENAAIRRGINPRKWTYDNITYMRKQIQSMGASFDMSREVVTCDPQYYRWTQWLFLQFFKNGLVSRKETDVNWCPSCKTVLANEQVKDNRCERCDSCVEQKRMKQWNISITQYADRLIDDLDDLDWPKEIKEQQKNWIGRSEGTIVKFPISNSQFPKKGQIPGPKFQEEHVEVFTTRADTIFGCTYIVLSPEHDVIKNIKLKIENYREAERYIEQAKKKSALQRTDLAKEKTGVRLEGVSAINPFTGEAVPVFVADYVLGSYGTGAVMGVPAHDERDLEFAKKYDLPIRRSVIRDVEKNFDKDKKNEECFTDDGILVDSQKFSGLSSREARQRMTAWLEKTGNGKRSKQYKLRDWTVSRQRYWGVPIPIVHCEKCGSVPVPEKDLPVQLPEIKDYLPHETGQSPLAKAARWVRVECPVCGGSAKRETDTLDTFVCSSWYFLRYLDPQNEREFSAMEKQKLWMPVDLYSGGAEHTTMHLLYSRFFYKALFDLGLVTHSEPYAVRMNRGLILGPDGNKMSKSKGNVIDPDDVVREFGADAMRLYLAFIGPYNVVGAYPWNTESLSGVRRFLDKIWRLIERAESSKQQAVSGNGGEKEIEGLLHKTIKKVTEDIETFRFNTAISSLMILANRLEKESALFISHYSTLILLLSPFAPHIAEELWEKMGRTSSIFLEKWPKWDEKLIVDETITMVLQVNGKVRDTIFVPADIAEEDIKKLALASKKVQKFIDGKEVQKTIFVKGKLVNIVTA